MLTKEQLQKIVEDPKAFLNRSYNIDTRIKTKKARIAYLHSICKSTTQSIKPVVVYTGAAKKVEACISEALDIEAEIREDILELQQIQRETAEAIYYLLDDVTLQTLLEQRYLASMRWEEIAVNMNYAYRWVMRLHVKALRLMKIKAFSLLAM